MSYEGSLYPANHLPLAAGGVRGAVIVGTNIGLSAGTISINGTNVTNALGYTPEDQANKNASNGYAGLSGGLLTASQLPLAAGGTRGAVIVGSNITLASGTISLTGTNITTALGYTPFNSAGGTIGGNTVINGNLTVTGTTFQVNSTSVDFNDRIIQVNWPSAGVGVSDPAPTLATGISVYVGSNGSSVANDMPGITWDNANSRWTTAKVKADDSAYIASSEQAFRAGNITSTGTITATTQFTGPATGLTGIPGAQITGANSIPASTLPLATGAAFGAVQVGSGLGITAGVISNAGVTAFAVSGSGLSVTASTGSITLSFANQNANLVLAGPASGGAAAPAYRALVPLDLPVATAAALGAAQAGAGIAVSAGVFSVSPQAIVRTNRVVTAAGAVTVTTADDIVIINKTVGAATVVNLPATPTNGEWFTIKDGKGDAGTNTITITPAAGTIDGQATHLIESNYGSRELVYNGTEWNVM
jgi:hypothetical protein